MRRAILYIRVSTDEQALRGYSQRTQYERLYNFCMSNNITIVQVIYEDHSAKSFNRPEWKKLMLTLSKNKADHPDLLLFTRWDRFSRNTADAYDMITKIQKLGIELQAIDQPLNMAIPESKVLMAMYIVTSEVENDRRSLNVKYGMHKAKQEGRWLGQAPIGYISKNTDKGNRIIYPREPEATLIRNAFARLVEQDGNIPMLYKQSTSEGLRCSLNGFRCLLRNPVYCGRIKVPAFEEKAGYEVKGIHEPIISEQLFDEAQYTLSNQKRTPSVKQSTNDLFPLKGFLYCPTCVRKLQGSRSKGNTKYYCYYHCQSPCKFRVRADEAHRLLEEGIGRLTINQKYILLYKDILKHTYKSTFEEQIMTQEYITQNIRQLISRSVKSKELLLKGTIDEEDFLAIRTDCETRISIMGRELHQSRSLTSRRKNNLSEAANTLASPLLLYKQIDLTAKRKLLRFLLAENLVYNNATFERNLNTAAEIIYTSSYAQNTSTSKNEIETMALSQNLSERERDVCNQITAIENGKGRTISRDISFSLYRFLTDFAKIHMEYHNSK